MHRLFRPAQLAFHFAAPVEGTSASFYYNHFLRSIASTTAHQIAAIYTYGGVVALPPVSSLNSKSRISFTEVRRLFHVDQVFCVWRFVVWVVGFQLEVVSKDENIFVSKWIQWQGLCKYLIEFKWNLPIDSLVVWSSRLYRVAGHGVWTAGNILRCLNVMTNCVFIRIPQTIAD